MAGPWEKYAAQQSSEVARDTEGVEYFPNDQGQLTSRELIKGHTKPSRFDAVGQGYLDGYTLNSMDEIQGATQGRYAMEKTRARQDVNRESYPGLTATGTLMGYVGSPVNQILPGTGTIKGATAVAAGTGAVDAGMRAEGDIAERGKDALTGGVTSALFGAALSSAFKGGESAVRSLYRAKNKAPTLKQLKNKKTAAYLAVDRSGERFTHDEITRLAMDALDIAKNEGIDQVADPQTTAAINNLVRLAENGNDIPLSQFDRTIVRNLWKRYDQSKGTEVSILDVMRKVDDLLSTKAEGSALMKTARAENSKFMKAKLLETAFKHADLDTARSNDGTGGLINRYKAAVVRILKNEKESKFFSPEELKAMENFVFADTSETVLRRIGKLSPNGNGLMAALNVAAIASDPSFLGLTAAASGAKVLTDRTAVSGARALRDQMALGITPSPLQRLPLGGPTAGGAMSIQNYLKDTKD